MRSLDEEDGVTPMSEEQSLVRQVQSLGAFGVVDWEAVGLEIPSPDPILKVYPLFFLNNKTRWRNGQRAWSW